MLVFLTKHTGVRTRVHTGKLLSALGDTAAQKHASRINVSGSSRLQANVVGPIESLLKPKKTKRTTLATLR